MGQCLDRNEIYFVSDFSQLPSEEKLTLNFLWFFYYYYLPDFYLIVHLSLLVPLFKLSPASAVCFLLFSYFLFSLSVLSGVTLSP